MIYIPKYKAVIFAFFLLLFFVFLPFFKSDNEKAFSESLSKRIVIDAGHGLPDGGAVGMNGTIESTLNLKIARILESILREKGFSVIMTRSGEESIFQEGKSISLRKRGDMYKRLEIIKTSSADIFVSIHMNKFSDSRYCGAQVIYSDNFKESEYLASLLQKRLTDLKDNKSKRTHLKAPPDIFLLKNSPIPSVIVECGFLSNYEEEKLLNTEEYQKAIAKAIANGITDYCKKQKRSAKELDL